MELKKMEGAIEAILFAMGEAVPVKDIAKTIGHDTETTRKIIRNMMLKYQTEDRGIKIIELEESFQMCTKEEYYDYLVAMALQPKKAVLSDVMLETLSIIAYKQPVTKLEIEKIRGVKSDHAVNKLIEYGLVREVGRLDAPGRPILFGTTEEFLRNFGVQGLDDLPEIDPVQSSFSLTYKRILQTGRELFVVSFFVPVHTLLNKGVKVCSMSGERSDRYEKSCEILDRGDPGLSGNLLLSGPGAGRGGSPGAGQPLCAVSGIDGRRFRKSTI